MLLLVDSRTLDSIPIVENLNGPFRRRATHDMPGSLPPPRQLVRNGLANWPRNAALTELCLSITAVSMPSSPEFKSSSIRQNQHGRWSRLGCAIVYQIQLCFDCFV